MNDSRIRHFVGKSFLMLTPKIIYAVKLHYPSIKRDIYRILPLVFKIICYAQTEGFFNNTKFPYSFEVT